MSGSVLKMCRRQRRWTQSETARRLGVSQAYVALLESGKRPFSGRVARRARALLDLSPTVLPPMALSQRPVPLDKLARQLAALGYPGFAYLRAGWRKNPAELLVTALQQPNLESRIAEALPWVLLRYADLDHDWLVAQARLSNLSNRLGFVVDLARAVAERQGKGNSPSYHRLTDLADRLRASRLDVEDTLCQESLTEAERQWLRANRPEQAKYWHLLTDWQPEYLQYAV